MDREFPDQAAQSPEEKELFANPQKLIDDITGGFNVKFPPEWPSQFAEHVRDKVKTTSLDRLSLEERAYEVIDWFNELAKRDIGDDLKPLVESDLVIMTPSSGVADRVAKVVKTGRLNCQANVTREYVPPAKPSRLNVSRKKRQVAVTSSTADKFFGRSEPEDDNFEPLRRRKPRRNIAILDSGLQTVSGVDLNSGLPVMATRLASWQEVNRRRDAGQTYISLYDRSATDELRPERYGREIPNETYLADFNGFILELLKEKSGEPAAAGLEKLRANMAGENPELAATLEQTATKELMIYGCLDESGQITKMAKKCLETAKEFKTKGLAEARTLAEAKDSDCLREVEEISQLIDDLKSNRTLLDIESQLSQHLNNDAYFKPGPLLDRWLDVLIKLQELSEPESKIDPKRDLNLDKNILEALHNLPANLKEKSDGIKRSFIAGHLPLLAKHYLFSDDNQGGGYSGQTELAKNDYSLDNSMQYTGGYSSISSLYGPDQEQPSETLLFVAEKIVGFGSQTNKMLLNGEGEKWPGRNSQRISSLSVPDCLTEVSPDVLEKLSPYLYHKVKPWLERQQQLIEKERLKKEAAAAKEKERLAAIEAEKIAAEERKKRPPSGQDLKNLSDFFKNR